MLRTTPTTTSQSWSPATRLTRFLNPAADTHHRPPVNVTRRLQMASATARRHAARPVAPALRWAVLVSRPGPDACVHHDFGRYRRHHARGLRSGLRTTRHDP